VDLADRRGAQALLCREAVVEAIEVEGPQLVRGMWPSAGPRWTRMWTP
jgi:hypothetical protein